MGYRTVWSLQKVEPKEKESLIRKRLSDLAYQGISPFVDDGNFRREYPPGANKWYSYKEDIEKCSQENPDIEFVILADPSESEGDDKYTITAKNGKIEFGDM